MPEIEKLSSVEHWESEWSKQPIRSFTTVSYFDMRMHRCFARAARPGDRVAEIGCGGSRWLRYFDQHWNAEVWGIDYSKTGLEQTKSTFDQKEKKERILYGDFFAENGLPQDYFDLVYSLGFVEHFSDVPSVLARCRRHLRPGGLIVTMIPNFAGWYGPLQKFVGRDLYDIHHVMDKQEIHQHHLDAGLAPVVPAEYLGCFAPLLVSWSRCNQWSPLLTRLAVLGTKVLQQAVCWTLHLVRLDLDTRALSPMIAGIYRRPSEQE